MNVKKGDLAIVINSDKIENIGIICTVDAWLGDQYSLDRKFVVRNAWACTSIGREFFCPHSKASSKKFWVTDSCLRPIRGEPSEENLYEESPLATEC